MQHPALGAFNIINRSSSWFSSFSVGTAWSMADSAGYCQILRIEILEDAFREVALIQLWYIYQHDLINKYGILVLTIFLVIC